MMAGNTIQLTADCANVLCPLWYLNTCQLFHSHTKAQIVVHGRYIIQSVGKRHTLLIGTGLHQLFNTSMKIAHNRLGSYNILSIQLHLYLEYTVGTRMLRAHI